jgi:hypothetical protein
MLLEADRVGALALKKLTSLTGLAPSSLVGLVKEDDGWKVTIEMVEKKSIPESLDILASYDVWLDGNGDLKGFTRSRLRRRSDTDQP